MLKQLRKKGVAKKVLWVVAVIIILSFGVFGTANYASRRSGPRYAGKIFGQQISFDEFQKVLLHTRNDNILRYGENFEKISQFLNLESEAWDRLILLHEAKKRHIHVIDQEVVDKIQDFEFLKNKGVFDAGIYNKIVRYVFRCEPRDFEEGVRETLIFSKLFDHETLAVTASEADVEDAYKKKNEQVQVSYVLFTADDYKKEAIVEASEAQNYFNEHKEEFRLPPAINIEYLSLDYPVNAQAQEKSDIALKAQEIHKELQSGGDLEKVGKKYNVESKESGFFDKEQPDLKVGLSYEVLQKAFDLERNQISDPMETSKGYVIFKVKEKRDSNIPDFKDASDKVTEVLATKKAQDLAKQKVQESLKVIKDQLAAKPAGASFANIIATLGLKTTQTPFFTRGQYLPVVGLSQEFQESAFSLNEKNPISDTIEVAKGFCILHFENYVSYDKEKFSKEKDALAKTLLDGKRNETFSKFLSDLRAKANLVDNITPLKKDVAP